MLADILLCHIASRVVRRASFVVNIYGMSGPDTDRGNMRVLRLFECHTYFGGLGSTGVDDPAPRGRLKIIS
jgi:hypothetical protein